MSTLFATSSFSTVAAPPPNAHTPSQPTTLSTATAPAQTAEAKLPGDGDLWSSILDSVKGGGKDAGGLGGGGGGVGGTRQCVVLGSPNSGKSTLLARLRSSSGELPSSSGAANGAADGEGGGEKHLDLGMSYEVLDVRDEGDEGETLARLSLFHLSHASPSPSPPSSSSLLSLALNRATLLSSLVVIVLDWQNPWKWVEELEGWMAVVEERLRGLRSEGGAQGRETFEEVEGRERLEAFIRAYHEPPAASSSSIPAPATTTATYDPDAPLPPGTLTDNLGVGIVIVCTKADQMNALEREREFTDEQFDYIQQTLRTIALRYGAALFYTSQTSPPSYSKLRQYILHRLFATPSASSLAAATTSAVPPSPSSPSAPGAPSTALSRPAAAAATTTSSSSFPFPHRANVIDRDGVLVPAGWDSWGKIRVLRERFDAEAVGEGWARDVEARTGRAEDTEGEKGQQGLRKEYEMVVVDFEAEDQPINLSTAVSALDEQLFLKTHFETLQADAAKDPRLAFRQQPSSTSSTTTASSSPALGGLAPSVVGPMAGATLELPTVVSTLERARGADELGRSTRGGAGAAAGQAGEAFARGMSRQNSQTSASARSPPLDGPSSGAAGSRHSPSLSASLMQRSSSQTSSSGASPALPSASGAGGGTAGAAAGGNQVLADFFQSLLTARGAGGGAAGGAAGAGGAPGLGASTNRRPSEQRDGAGGK
ncbi:hypothetical protein JCM6882_004610 [Rhodosporidiobolus microsporus]